MSGPGSAPVATRRVLLALTPILLVTALVYSASFRNEFLNFDDPVNILQNASITAITPANLATYFTKPLMGMYSPLVYLSYAIDFRIGALDVSVYHATNLLLHLVNVGLVCFIVLRLTGHLPSALVVAALFAVSPVNVGAVAPLSVRSSLLYACFYLAAYLSYLSYPSYLLTFVLFLLSLLSKSAAVVFPLLLWLTDQYLGRPNTRRALLEKIPFLVTSALFGVLALMVRDDVTALSGAAYTAIERVCLVAYGILFYPAKLVFPVGLSALYDYPARVNGYLPVTFYVAPFALGALVWLAARFTSHRRLLVFGAGFCVLHVALVLKIVPVGLELAADRYAYVASVGVFFVGVEVCRQAAALRGRIGLAVAVLIVAIFSASAFVRIGDWRDSITFYTRVLARDPANAAAHNNLGRALTSAHRSEEAIAEYREAIRLQPAFVQPHLNLAEELVSAARVSEAIPELRAAIDLEPANANLHAALGLALSATGRAADAIPHLEMAVRLDPADHASRTLLETLRAKH